MVFGLKRAVQERVAAWGRGRGYYEGMTDQELLGASRLGWRFQPDSQEVGGH